MRSPLLEALLHHPWTQLRWQLLVILGVLVLALAVGMWLERRFMQAAHWRDALRVALGHGVGLPAVALLLLQFVRHGSPLLLRAPLLKLALPVLAVWLLVRVAARVSHRLYPRSEPIGFLVRGLSWMAWLGLLLYLSGALPEIVEALDAVSLHIGNQRLTGWTLLRGIVSIVVTLVLALWVSSLLESRLLLSPLDINLRLVLSRLIRAAIFTTALLVGLQMVGIDLTVLGVFGGALGVGLGLGLQRIAANYVSGFVILLERSLRVGDNVRLDPGFQGKILDIKTRYTVVRSSGGTESIVPNEMLISNRIENLSYTDPNVWMSTTVSVGYDSDLDTVLPLIREAAAAVPRILRDPAPSAVLSNFGADGLEITLGYWIADPENGTLNVRGAVNLAIWHALKSNSVDIPFPQRVLRWAPGQGSVAPAAQAALAEQGPGAAAHMPGDGA
ncbi:MAG: mechanosensitive ion channel protein MscS [Thiomonas sp. 15-66-11]|jgi:small-conductance mechanosensitive channel|uniref:Putative mechanosensitive ion channel protein n=1 Tax=Thiomonas delicata TaxID=364030 RepID=A0A238D989_THIDL|nr:mechanosensitive ion channel domain-containing protein [Thiomonas delicata]OZB46365.1 MAG: mechanosensitive ion channel protein MscS [Thiomonas sp. 15-66-11]SBP89898.1 putative mechanosensitive ion channel protein [Thiomonas delicata]